jgi:hypothetical protein
MTNSVVNDDRLIKGTILRYVDGKWSDADGLQPPEPLIAMGTTECLQRWSNGKPTEVVMKRGDEALSDLDELNNKIPVEEWENGPDGKPRAPWVRQAVAYFVDPVSAEAFTYLNSTWGARIAVERLAERVANMRRLRGAAALPLVKLESRPMKTKFGTKQRPEFKIVEWRGVADAPKALAAPTPSEELNDEIPAFGA